LYDLHKTNTIVAVATPPGRGGVGVVRLSGADALVYARNIVLDEIFVPKPTKAYLRKFYDPATSEPIDEGILIYYKSPHSYTGEDVIEFQCHGSPLVLSRIVSVIINLGARDAEPGEFTLQALSNKKLTLNQAEAVRDLINSRTHVAVQQAVRQLNGELSFRLQPLKSSLLEIIVSLESSLEFVEEDLPSIHYQEVEKELSSLINTAKHLAETYDIGRSLNDGYKVVLVGRPNTGKSSIFNRLLSFERSIVTDLPGTTRDSLSEFISLEGLPVLLVDTAGVRSSEDQIERLGIERTRRAMADADLVIVVIDNSCDLDESDREILSSLEGSRHLLVINKIDVESNCFPRFHKNGLSKNRVMVSAKSGEGIEFLKSSIAIALNNETFDGSNYVVTNVRHYDLLRCTIKSLESSLALISNCVSEELVLVGLYDSLHYLGDITGETTSDDVLGEIFATFCIGK
jgi:tRNA modification GTPase